MWFDSTLCQVTARSAFILVALHSLARAAPPGEGDPREKGFPEHREQQFDPYVPSPPPGWEPPWSGFEPRVPPVGSVQVNVNASGANIVGDAANEPSMAIDPTNPNRIVIGWRQFDSVTSNFRQAGWAYSTNAGQSWTFPGSLEPGVFRSDPVLVADAFGRFFYNSLRSNFCIDVFRSTDGGVTWPQVVPAFGGDKQWMAVDPRATGQGAGHLYAAWQSGAHCSTTGAIPQFTRSTNAGVNWMTPISIPNTPSFGTLTVAPDGEVLVCGINGASFNSSNIVVARSTNARNPAVTPTWDFSVVGNFLGGAVRGAVGPNPAGLLGQVQIEVNRATGMARGHVYLLCSVDPTGSDPMDVKFSRSVDGGMTWSAPVRVNDDPTTNGAWQWFGTMSLAPNGRIDAFWNDTRDDSSNRLSRLYYAYSLDEGATWSANIALTPAWDSTVGFPQQDKIGDYYHALSDNAGVSLAYAATFNQEQDVYFTRVLPNDCNTNGTPDAADVSSGHSPDCNSNAVPDECEADCNTNNRQDDCDIILQLSIDCNTTGIPDECEDDCNTNGFADVCDINSGNAADCNTNFRPDVCDAGFEDCNTNGFLDQCESFLDCNTNSRLDECDVGGGAADCNTNAVPDDCESPLAAAAADNCMSGAFITTNVVYRGVTRLTTNTDGACSCAPSGRDVYYRYRPTMAGLFSISLCSETSFDTVLSIHTGCPAVVANELPNACNDDYCAGGGPSGLFNIPVAPGTTYLIRISGYDNGGAGGDTGPFTFGTNGPPGVGDCNLNGIPDDCEIAAGEDLNGNGVPDSCDPFPPCLTCPGDMTGNASRDGDDLQRFIQCLFDFPPAAESCACADLDGDHHIDAADAAELANRLMVTGCP